MCPLGASGTVSNPRSSKLCASEAASLHLNLGSVINWKLEKVMSHASVSPSVKWDVKIIESFL